MKLMTGTNNACSFKQKMDMIKTICFLYKVMHKKDAEKYPTCASVLEAIFNVKFTTGESISNVYSFSMEALVSFANICDDLVWGTNDEIEKPEGVTSAKEIKNQIINYFTEEWSPF